MAGIQNILTLVPPLLVGNLSITSPQALTLSQARILGSTDPIYGTAGGWTTPTDGSPWALIVPGNNVERAPEPYRKWIDSQVDIFVGIDLADTPAVQQNYKLIALAWIDAVRQFIPKNWLLMPGALTLDPNLWDIRWEMLDGQPQDAWGKKYVGADWCGALIKTRIRFSTSVTYQG
jgi:hypothetical protein